MKRLLLLAVLLVPLASAPALAQSDAARIATAKARVKAQLKDPNSARFASVRVNPRTKMVCGTVNARNSFGGYTGPKPFIYAPSENEVIIPPDEFYASPAASDVIAQSCDPAWRP